MNQIPQVRDLVQIGARILEDLISERNSLFHSIIIGKLSYDRDLAYDEMSDEVEDSLEKVYTEAPLSFL